VARPEAPEVRVWDPLLRACHWTLAAAVLLAWGAAEAHGKLANQIHQWAGYAALAAVALRLAWGWRGPRYARFAQFVAPAAQTLAYAKQVAAHREPRHLGHNPLGAWMIVALLAGAALAAGSGWLFVTDRFWGEKWLAETHEVLAHGLLLLAGLHLAGVVFTSLRQKENLARAMLTGRKRAPGPGDVA